jgi:hypothetical protein
MTTLAHVHEVPGRLVAPSEAASMVGRSAFLLTGALAVVAALACVASIFVPDVLRGPAAPNGQLRGTAAVVTLIGLPVLVLSAGMVARGSSRALFGWVGAIGFIAYQGVLFLFASPFNSLFLLYVAMLSLAVWSLISVVPQIRVDALAASISRRAPVRVASAYLAVMATLFGALWLKAVIPPSLANTTPTFLAGTGMLTGPGQVMDLGFTLPLMFAGAIQLWRRRPWGYVVSGSLLVMLAMETISIATDQWFGHAADPTSPAAAIGLVPVFAAITVLGLGVLVAFFARWPDPTDRLPG